MPDSERAEGTAQRLQEYFWTAVAATIMIGIYVGLPAFAVSEIVLASNHETGQMALMVWMMALLIAFAATYGPGKI